MLYLLRRPIRMQTIKEEAKALIDKLPNQANWDDIMYELYVKKKISLGLTSIRKGKVFSHAQAKKRLLGK